MKEQFEKLMLRDATNDFEVKLSNTVTFDKRDFTTLESFASYMDKSNSNRIITEDAVYFLFKGRFYTTGEVYKVTDIYEADEIEVIISQEGENTFISCDNYDVKDITNYEFVKKLFEESDLKSNVDDDAMLDEETKNNKEEEHDGGEASGKEETEIENEETIAKRIQDGLIEDQKYRDEFLNQEITPEEITERLNEMDNFEVFTRSERIEREVLRAKLAKLRIGPKPPFLANNDFKIGDENLGKTNNEEDEKKKSDKNKKEHKPKSDNDSNKERKENNSKLNDAKLEDLIERLAKLKKANPSNKDSDKSKIATKIDRYVINVFTKNHRISCLESEIKSIEKTLKEATTNVEEAELAMNAVEALTEDEKIERKKSSVERNAHLRKLQTKSNEEIEFKQKLIESVEKEDKVDDKIFDVVMDTCFYHGLDFPKTKIKRLRMDTDFNYIMNLIDLHNAYVLMKEKGDSGELPNKLVIFNGNCQLTKAEQFEYDLIEKSTFKGFELTSDRIDYVIDGLKNMHVCIICLHFAYFNLHTLSTLGHWTKGINVLFTTENDYNLKISLYNLCKRITTKELNILMAAAPVISYILSELPTSKFYSGKASLSFVEGTVYVTNRNNFVNKVVEKFTGPNQKDISKRASMTIDKALVCLSKMTEKQYANVNKRIQFLKLDVAQTQTQVPQEAIPIPQEAKPQEKAPLQSIFSFLRR